jgi:hypothetical protein
VFRRHHPNPETILKHHLRHLCRWSHHLLHLRHQYRKVGSYHLHNLFPHLLLLQQLPSEMRD